MIRQACYLLAAAICAFTASVTAASTAHYTITDLGPAEAVAINASGQVLLQGDHGSYSAVWLPNKPNAIEGAVWDIGQYTPEEYDPEYGLVTESFALNDLGDIVGMSGSGWRYKGSPSAEPFRTRIGKQLTKQSLLYGGAGFIPHAINNRGLVVGEIRGTGNCHAAKRLFTGKIVSLGKLGGDKGYACQALGVNDRGTIVGWSDDHAWVITGNHMRDLGDGTANAINNRGVICGASHKKACVWIGGCARILDSSDHSGQPDMSAYCLRYWSFSEANDINDRGQAVGSVGMKSAAFAALWQNHKQVDLNTLIKDRAWHLNSAVGINEKGQIIGVGTYRGKTHSFLLTSVKPR